MKIRSVQARAVDVGFLSQSLQTARIASPMSRWPQFAEKRARWMWPSKKTFVRIETDDGSVGWGCTNGGEVSTLVVNEQMARLLVGAPTADHDDLWEQMFNASLPMRPSGFAMMAIAGIDIALWDLRSQHEDKSLLALLGGIGTSDLPVYVTSALPEAVDNDAWWGLKVAMPYGLEAGEQGLEDNVAIMKLLRDRWPNQRLMIDAYMAWDADYTERFVDRVAELDLAWIEDPMPPFDLDGFRQVKERAGGQVRLALGNFCFHRWDCLELLRDGLVDILQPDVAWVGGITECQRIFDLAGETTIMLHNSCEQPWALALAASHSDRAVAEFVDRGADSPLYSLSGSRAQIDSGRVVVPDTVGANHPPQCIQDLFQT